ncbi:MAG TPA: glycosyltransferase [Candidatus Angelobacter sp.]|nr:glycosyltransferase [Candidatus Angelobacter sp.]
MKRKVLLVSSDNPYPVVMGGFERLIIDYQDHLFRDYDVYLLLFLEEGMQLLHYGKPVWSPDINATLLSERFEFIYFVHPGIDFSDPVALAPLTQSSPSFCFVQRHPDEDIPDVIFRGMVTHFSERPTSDVLRLGGSYNPAIFYEERQPEDFILCVARISPEKNQLDLVRGYKEKIYARYGLPLYLVGGANDMEYFQEILAYVDNLSVFCTADRERPGAAACWRSSVEIAALCNRARIFVMPSPSESFCLAMIEAMACGTTCVVNGDFFGFDEDDLAPRVFGNVRGSDRPILDVLDEALHREIRTDSSEWVKKFSLPEIRNQLMPFIQDRLHQGNGALPSATAGNAIS